MKIKLEHKVCKSIPQESQRIRHVDLNFIMNLTYMFMNGSYIHVFETAVSGIIPHHGHHELRIYVRFYLQWKVLYILTGIELSKIFSHNKMYCFIYFKMTIFGMQSTLSEVTQNPIYRCFSTTGIYDKCWILGTYNQEFLFSLSQILKIYHVKI